MGKLDEVGIEKEFEMSGFGKRQYHSKITKLDPSFTALDLSAMPGEHGFIPVSKNNAWKFTVIKPFEMTESGPVKIAFNDLDAGDCVTADFVREDDRNVLRLYRVPKRDVPYRLKAARFDTDPEERFQILPRADVRFFKHSYADADLSNLRHNEPDFEIVRDNLLLIVSRTDGEIAITINGEEVTSC